MKKKKSVKYAVVGLGHIAQVAVLPGFKHLKRSKLSALVSGDAKKRKVLSKRYDVKSSYTYEEFDLCLKDPSIDAIYIALPNAMHLDYCLKSIEAGKHVLCEKPLAVSVEDAKKIIVAAARKKVKLMTAYRLHFDPMNLRAIQIARSGKIGEPRYFTSEFGHQVKEDNIRALPSEGGSPLHDLGIYCINAARYIMRAEPIEVFAMVANPAPRLPQIDQTVTAMLRFPGDRVATFLSSFASAGVSNFRVIGDKGDLFVENAYEYVGKSKNTLTISEKKKTWKTRAGDQFAAELEYFSSCILDNREPETSGKEGLADLVVIEALLESLKTGQVVRIGAKERVKKTRPTLRQAIKKPPHRKPTLIHAAPEAK